MSSEQHENASDAIEEAIAWHTIAIIAGTGQRELREIGTGTAISFGGHHFILTARHVVEDTPNELLRFFCRPDGPLERAERAQLRRSGGIRFDQLHLLEHIPVADRMLCNEEDLAVLFVDPGLEERHRVRFFALDEASATPTEGQVVIAMGYPADIARQIETGNFVTFSSVEWSEIVVNRELPDYDSERHFLAQYHMVEDEPRAHPRGFSGCGVWFRIGPTPAGEIWLPNLCLAGVFVSYYSRPAMLKGVRVERVIEFLRTVV